MKKLIAPCLLIYSFIGSLDVSAQGVMPVPVDAFIYSPSCNQGQQLDIFNDPLQRAFTSDLSSILCKDESLYSNAFEFGANYQHDRSRCDEISFCSSTVKNEDVKDAEILVSQNIPTVVLLSTLTKAIEENREYNVALYQYEQKHKSKLCTDEAIDFDCDHKVRLALAAVPDSLIDFPEFDRAPTSADKLLSFIPNKFFSKESVMVKSEEELKKDCSKKFSLQKVCTKARERIKIVKECDRGTVGKNCFEEEQRAWASLTNDFRNNNKDLYLAIEKQLCLPQRAVKSTSQSGLLTRTRRRNPYVFKAASQDRLTSGLSRTTQLMASAKMNAESSTDSKTPSEKDVKTQDDYKFGEGLRSASQAIPRPQGGEDVIHGFDSQDSLADSFGENLHKVSENFKSPSNTNTNTVSNWDVIGRARELAEEERIKAEELKNKVKEDDKSVVKVEADKKQDEADALITQINGLKSKLDDMTEKMEELQGKKESSDSKETAVEQSSTEKEILELKKQIAELEADKKRKEAEAKALRSAEENRLTKEREERSRNSFTAPATFASTTRQTNAQTAEAAAAVESEKASRNLAASFGGNEGSRGPASVASGPAVSGSQANVLVLKAVGSQATPESNVVYMTANELQRYPYRLGEQASTVEIEKMLEGNQGSTIIIGNSEQIVPVMEKGKIVLDENGKIKYKRIKISLVKNDKERKMQIEREISSVADLKKEEQKKRDLIRYQEMKKALLVK